MAMTAREVYELAKKLPKREQRKLLRWLSKDLEQSKGKGVGSGKGSKAKLRDPLADDPWFAELREGMQKAMKELGFRTVEEVMTWLRGRPWRFDE